MRSILPTPRPYQLPRLDPLAQLRAGRLVRRLPQLLGGLGLYGWSMAMMIKAGLGLDPWDIFHQGLTRYLPLSFGQITMVVGALVLLRGSRSASGPAWAPSRTCWSSGCRPTPDWRCCPARTHCGRGS